MKDYFKKRTKNVMVAVGLIGTLLASPFLSAGASFITPRIAEAAQTATLVKDSSFSDLQKADITFKRDGSFKKPSSVTVSNPNIIKHVGAGNAPQYLRDLGIDPDAVPFDDNGQRIVLDQMDFVLDPGENATTPANQPYTFDGDIVFTWDKIAFDADGNQYDLRTTFSNITYTPMNVHTDLRAITLRINHNTNRINFDAQVWSSRGTRFAGGVSTEVHTELFYAGTNTPANKMMHMSFDDIDAGSNSGVPDYAHESITFLDGFNEGKAYTRTDSWLITRDDGSITNTYDAGPDQSYSYLTGFIARANTDNKVKIVVPSVAGNTLYSSVHIAQITASSSEGGSISDEGKLDVPWKWDAPYTATPDTGYKVSKLTVDGAEVTPSANYTFPAVTENHTIHVDFSPIAYSIAFDANGGTGEMSDQDMIYDVAENLSDNAFTREGHDFLGWATSPDGDVVYSDAQEVINLTTEDGGKVTLYAVWKAQPRTVTYVDGKTGETIATDTVNYGDPSTPPTAPEHTGFIPGDWDKDTSKVVEDMTVTIPYDPINYMIVFDKNADDAKGVVPSQTMSYDVASNLNENKFTRDGYKWVGWIANDDTKYTNKQEVVNLTNVDKSIVVLKAQWEALPLTVTYVDGLTKDIIEKDVVKYGDRSESPEMPTHKGYTPVGWDKTLDKVIKDTIVTLEYRPNKYVISFDTNGGTGKMDDQSMQYDLKAQLNRNVFKRDGFEFTGWKDENGKEYTDVQEVINLTDVDGGKITLKAQWKAIPQEKPASTNTPSKTTTTTTATATSNSKPGSLPTTGDASVAATTVAGLLGFGAVSTIMSFKLRKKNEDE